MMKLAILGSGGRLGAALAREYAQDFEVLAFDRQALDLAQPEALEKTLSALDFDALINCAALTNVDYCETNEAESMAINADAAGLIGSICAKKNARCIHISTDYVFDGEKREPYTENDPARAISVYGESKLRGEKRLAEATDGAGLSVRVSWVFGPDRLSFVDGVIKRALENDQAAAVADKWAVPTYTLDVATMLKPFINELRAEGGVLHLCNGGVASWQEYGQYALNCAAAAGMPLKTCTVGALKLTDLKNFVAARPVYSAMATDRLERLVGKPREWKLAVAEYVCRHVAVGPVA
jgi:dTDP-4-dehydrorhamnose reductase